MTCSRRSRWARACRAASKAARSDGAGRQGITVEGLAEIGEVAIARAAEGGAVASRRGRDHDGLRVLEGIDESTGIAGGDDDHPPADPGLAQRVREVLGRQVDERKP